MWGYRLRKFTRSRDSSIPQLTSAFTSFDRVTTHSDDRLKEIISINTRSAKFSAASYSGSSTQKSPSATLDSTPVVANITLPANGFSDNAYENPESEVSLGTLRSMIAECTGINESQHLSSIFLSLRPFSCASSEVRLALSEVATKLDAGGKLTQGDHVGNCLLGLQGMSSDRKEVGRLLASLTRKLDGFEGFLTAQDVSNALFGLRRMHSTGH